MNTQDEINLQSDRIRKLKEEIEQTYRSMTGARVTLQLKQAHMDHLSMLYQSYEDRLARLKNKLADLECQHYQDTNVGHDSHN